MVFKHLALSSSILFCSSAISQTDYPDIGKVYGKSEARSIEYKCEKTSPLRIKCEFDLDSVSLKLNPSKVSKMLNERMQHFERAKDEIKTGSACKELEGNIAELKSIPEMDAEGLEGLEGLELYIKFCNNPTKDNWKETIKADLAKDSKTCRVSSQEYTLEFKKIVNPKQDKFIWSAVSEPSGICGAVETSRFESLDKKNNTLWKYFYSKVITNKNAETNFFGLKCADLDESEYPYTYYSDAKKLNCEYIEFSVF